MHYLKVNGNFIYELNASDRNSKLKVPYNLKKGVKNKAIIDSLFFTLFYAVFKGCR